MEFYEITEDQKATPGEYIYHEPSMQIVLCGSFNRKNNMIKAIASGKIMSDKIDNFKKIKLDKKDLARKQAYSRCKGCGS